MVYYNFIIFTLAFDSFFTSPGMINLIFFKESESLKDTVADLHFSSTERLNLFFPLNRKEVEFLICKKELRGLLFFFAPHLNKEDMQWINYYSLYDPELYTALYADQSYALEAWKTGAFHFEPYPIISSKVVSTFKKFQRIKKRTSYTYSVKTPEGVFNLPTRDILYIHAAGNYSLIHLSNDKTMLLTRQLGTYDDLLESTTHFDRVHRSLILNKAAVKTCTDQKIYFHQSSKPLEISAALESRLKKRLINA